MTPPSPSAALAVPTIDQVDSLRDDLELSAALAELEQIKLDSDRLDAREKELKEYLGPTFAVAGVSALRHGTVVVTSVPPSLGKPHGGAIDPQRLTQLYGLSAAEIDLARADSSGKVGYLKIDVIGKKSKKSPSTMDGA